MPDIRANLLGDIRQSLSSKLAIGESRHQDKMDGIDSQKIYSWNTYNTYKDVGDKFGKFCKHEYGCKTMADAESHIKDYMEHRRFDDKVSAYTQKMELSAIGKMYGKSYFQEVETDARHRADITRSRIDTLSEKRFSEEKNQELVNFCKNTGLRRSEIEKLKGDSLVEKDGKYYVHVENGKGGKERDAYILNQNKDVIDKIKNTPDNEKVFSHIHTRADIHNYRSEYATAYYNSIARPESEIPYNERYCCRNELSGTHYDKVAMQEVSESLGHNRIDVIASNYLR